MLRKQHRWRWKNVGLRLTTPHRERLPITASTTELRHLLLIARCKLFGVASEIHVGLRHQPLASFDSGGVAFSLIKVITGKDRSTVGLHARPQTFTTSGIQTTDILAYLGFQRSVCPFTSDDGYCRVVKSDFDAGLFTTEFAQTNDDLKASINSLRMCGIVVPGSEGFGYFFGRQSQREPIDFASGYSGDGHRSNRTNVLNSSDDNIFNFVLTHIISDDGSGWVTHFAPKRNPLSDELRAVFRFIRLHEFCECPEFDFDQCHWLFVSAGGHAGAQDARTDLAHALFAANAGQFSSGIEKLIDANTSMSHHGMAFLPIEPPVLVAKRSIAQLVGVAKPPDAGSRKPSSVFDVVISFAGPDRPKAEELAVLLRNAGVKVFYDNFYPEMLWGKDLAVFFGDIYRRSAKYCVIFASREYNDRMWTIRERQYATARALEERQGEYILPIKVEDVEIPGVPPTLGYVTLANSSITDIATMLIRKLRASA